MEVYLDDLADEIKRLRRCINDLVGVVALPAVWTGREPSQIVGTLLDALLGMLRLDFVYARLEKSVDEPSLEIVRTQSRAPAGDPQQIAELFRHALTQDLRRWPAKVKDPAGGHDIAIVPLRLGLRDKVGVIVAGSQRPDFPQQTEKLLLDVAANQATIAVHEARRLREQTLRADELDLRVAARAKELAAANEQLKREIEERRLAEAKLLQEEQELKRSEARKTAILNAALDCIVTIDHESRIIEFNPAAERTFGYRREEVLGRRLADMVIPPLLRDRHRDAFARYLATGEDSVLGKRVEMTAVRADDSEFPVEVAVTRIPLPGPPSFTGYLRDITERRVSEGRWKRIVDNSAIGIAVTDLTGRFEVTNAHYQKLLGYAEEELRKMTYLGITVPEFRTQNSTLITELLKGERDQFNIEKQYRRKDGRLVWVRNNVSLLPGADGAPHNIMAIVEDISERKAAEESLNLTQTRLARAAQVATAAELSASIAHEVNQPLLGIITNASTCLRMLAADPPNVDGARETARRMIRDGNRAAEVVKRLRALFGKKAATRETVDLNDAAREVVALSSSDLKRARVLVQADLADGLPPVTGNRVQLQQVILNLLRNASDAMSDVDDRPRRLLIKTQRDADDRVRLAVQDSGVGFDPDAAERLFESFFTTKNSGMGIGLSVSRSIIESHRGRLWMEPNEGPGVTFSFSIPRQSEQAAGVRSVDAARVSTAAAP